MSYVSQKFANNGDTVLSFSSVNHLSCGCMGKCAYPGFTLEDHPDMHQWKQLVDKSVAWYLPSWISFFDSK